MIRALNKFQESFPWMGLGSTLLPSVKLSEKEVKFEENHLGDFCLAMALREGRNC